MPRLIVEKRKFPRVDLALSGLLLYRDGAYATRLENISVAGALLTIESDCPLLTRGERCFVALYRSGGGGPMRLKARVVHFGYDMASVKFDNLDQNTRLMLRSMVAHQMPEPRPVPARISRRRG